MTSSSAMTRAIYESRVGKMADMVVEAGKSRAPVVQLADRVAGWFVGVVVCSGDGDVRACGRGSIPPTRSITPSLCSS
jgi:hypothetical protein